MKEKLLSYFYIKSIEYLVHWRKHSKEYFWIITFLLIIRANVFVVFRIPSGSMIPTFRVGDMVLANRFYYGLKLPFTDELDGFRLPPVREPEVGDVVPFIGPRDNSYYDLLVDLREDLEKFGENLDRSSLILQKRTQPKFELLKNLNRSSKFKRAISPFLLARSGEEKDFFNQLLDGEANYIFSDLRLDASSLVALHLHEKVYAQYREQIDSTLTVISRDRRKSTMTYAASVYPGFLHQFFKTYISFFSITADLLVDTPFLIWVKPVGELWFGTEWTFYPNPWSNQSQEWVKRLIAKEGDKVELIGKKVYVNDRPLAWDRGFILDPYQENFAISKEALPHSPKGDDQVPFKHSIRLSAPVMKPLFDFDEKLWPYEPEGAVASSWRDSFGPVIVPEGHYFMMGDNRDESLDSRFFGPVPKWAVKGTPMYTFFPWSRRGVIR